MTTPNKGVMWDTIESNYWSSIKSARDREDERLHLDLQAQQSEIKTGLAEHYARRTQLTLELTQVKQTIDQLESRLDGLSDEFRHQKDKMNHDRINDDQSQRSFFAKHRSDGAQAPAADMSAQEHADRILAEKQANADAHMRNGFAPVNGGEFIGQPTGVRIVDSENNLVGEIRRLPHHDNRWIHGLLKLPVKQDAILRPGRKFTEEQFQSIFEPTDAKGAKWVGVMIQAKGDIQRMPCQYCSKNTGVFRECILIGGEDFPRCGNCEWSRQACHFPNGPIPQGPLGPRIIEGGQEQGPPPEYQSSNQLIPTTEGPMASRQKAGFTAFNVPGTLYKPGEQGPQPQPGMPLAPTKDDQGQIPAGGSATGPQSETESKKRPASDDEDEVILPEICKATMLLRDDGEVYTEPPCMAGVPVNRIRPGDPYWEPEWQDVDDVIGPQLSKWNEKLGQIKLNQNTTNAYRFQANRQVNRGNSIIRYFDQAEFSPYQLVGKELVTNGIVTYDTLFRLVATLEELKKFSTVDVTPLQWVRQRLCELYRDDSENFNLCKTVHDFYHDRKLVQLRKRNGFGNIGRPSGHKMLKKDGESSAAGSPAPRPIKRSRKSKNADTAAAAMAVLGRNGSAGPDSRSASPAVRGPGRPRKKDNGSPATQSTREEHDLMFDGYTSTDSYSTDPVKKGDWRIYQIKTKDFTSNEHITQYWHWLDGKFEHQVLRDVEPKPSWGLYESPINFHVKLEEIDDIYYAPGSLKVVVTLKADPNDESMVNTDVLIHFKRERTKRRFLHFCHKKSVRIVKCNDLYVDNAWLSTHSDSEHLPGPEDNVQAEDGPGAKDQAKPKELKEQSAKKDEGETVKESVETPDAAAESTPTPAPATETSAAPTTPAGEISAAIPIVGNANGNGTNGANTKAD